MANQIPLSGATNAAGGYELPTEQGALVTNGILQLSGAIRLAGDVRATAARKEQFTISLGQPTAAYVGEGARKPVTGLELSQGTMNVKKVATIMLFTDELKEDLRNGDLDALADTGIRSAIADVIDANILGMDSGTNITGAHDVMLRSTTATVELGTAADKLRLAISAAMGILEANGYNDPANMAVLLPGDAQQHFRDARAAVETTTSIYDQNDPLYGLQREFSTNLTPLSTAAGANLIKGLVVYKPNLHVRLRKDVTVAVSNEASINDGTSDRFLFQEDMQALRYVTRLAFTAHDLNRAVVKIVDAS